MAFSVLKSQTKNWSALGAAVCAALVFFGSVSDAEARRKRQKRAVYSPPFASIVIDANSGRVLQATNPDALRFPASITKVMTLYLLFEQLERGKLNLNSPITMSPTAARQPPSKLGIRPGLSITVEQAILALVTKSANDVAVAVAETIGGTEAAFARMMTAKAHALGMSRTRFFNASGLPNPHQVTTARDLTRLGRAIRSHFPRYYAYFSTPAFRFGRANLRNHNKLLGRVRGVDGIKTGYTRASGFNLLTSAQYGNRRIFAVVLGGRSGRSRDAIMANLVASHITRASTHRSIAAIAKPSANRMQIAAAPAEAAPVQALPPARPAAPQAAEAPAPQAKTGNPVRLSAFARFEPVQPAVVSGPGRSSDLIPTATIPSQPDVIDGSTRVRTVQSAVSRGSGRTATPSDLRWVKGPAARTLTRQPVEPESPAPVPPARIKASAKPASQKIATLAVKADEAPVEAAKRRPKAARSGVMIQVGATDDVDKAKALLERARYRSRGALASAQPFTEPVKVRGSTLYRARFAGLSEQSAERACKTLKRSGLGCFTTRN